MPSTHDDATILVRAIGEQWREPSRVGYLSESDMQQMLAEQPSLIPGVGPHALAAREFSTGVGPSDVVVVDQDGTVTVVECKLASNAEVRRKIVGQVLDYAARLWRMPLTDFDARWKQCSAGQGVLDALTEQAVADLAVALENGVFRLVLAVDEINEDLRRIVEFLNAHTNEQVTVLAVELRRVSHGGVDILTPRTFGGELARAKQDKAKREQREPWPVAEVLARLADISPTSGTALQRLITDLTGLGCEPLGTAATLPSMIFKLVTPDGQVSWPYAIYTGSTPNVQVNFHWLAKTRPIARDAFLDALAVDPLALDAPAIRESGYQKRPPVPLSSLQTEGVHQQLVAAVAALVEAEG